MTKEDLAWLHYCVSLLDILSGSEMSFIEDVKVDLKVMTFTGKNTNYYMFKNSWLNYEYAHTTNVEGLYCYFTVTR